MMIVALLAAAALPACQPVERENILGSDLAAAEPLFAKIPPDTVVGYAPLPGAHRTFTAGELARLGDRLGIAAEFHPLCFEYPMHRLERAKVIEAMDASLPGTKVELLEFSLYPVPRGEIVFPPGSVSRPSSKSGDPVMWRGYVRYAGNRRFAIWARALVPESEAEAVKRGGTVQVDVTSGGAHLKFEARAESGGAVGSIVTVRNASSGKTFPARVVGKNKVMVEPSE